MSSGIPAVASFRAVPRQNGRVLSLAQSLATLALFILGALIWVCQPKQAMGAPLVVPVSPPQVLLTAGAGLAILACLLTFQGRMPWVFKSSLSTLLALGGMGCVILGAALHLRGGPAFVDTLLYIDRWALPIFAALTLLLAHLFGASVFALIYGTFAGLAVTVVSIELSRRGFALPVGMLSDGRYSGFLNHPNQYGIAVSCTSPLIVVTLLRRGLHSKVIGLLMIGFYAIALAQSLSKTNFALFPIGLAFTFLLLSTGGIRKFLRATAIVAILSALLLAAAVSAFRVLQDYAPRDAQLLADALIDPKNAATVEDRENVWAEAGMAIRQRPVLGWGPGWSENNISVTHAHNLYLQVWIDAGLCGLSGAVLLTLSALIRLGTAARSMIRAGINPPEFLILQSACAVGAVIALFGNSMSSSLHTGTFVPYAFLVAISLMHPSLLGQPPRIEIAANRPASRRDHQPGLNISSVA